MGHRTRRPIVFLALVLALFGQALAAPIARPATETFYRRQAQGTPLTQTVVTQTVQTTQTAAGPVTEICNITFTPINGPNGQPVVQVVRQCTVTPGEPPASVSSSSSLSTFTLPFTTTTSSISSTTTLSSSAPTSTSSQPNGVSVLGISSVPISAVTPPPQTSPSTTTTSLKSTSSASGSPAVTVAPDNTSASPSATAQAAFQIPGKKISVLPIGLGIFAGISVIALIVVGLVTYERTKYRKVCYT
ncbi:hypothetical protein BC827DRAFT_344945 [Russula dissimulans]|nr:hypothetical protein BC827DRAFT_344945 [Russula dissimulans]